MLQDLVLSTERATSDNRGRLVRGLYLDSKCVFAYWV